MNSANRSLITAFFKSPAGGGGQEELAEEPCLYGCSRSGAGLEVAKLQQSWLPTRQSCARAPAIDSVVSENSCTSLLSLGSTTSEEEEGGGAGGRGFAVNLSGLLSQGFAAGMGMGMVHRGGPSFSLITPTEPPAEPLLSCDLTPTQPLLSCDLTVTHPPLSCDLTPLEAPLSHDLTSPELPLPSGVQVTQCSVSQLENGATILANRQRLVQTGESEDSFQIEAGDLQPLADPSQNMSGVPHSPAAGSVPNQSQLWAGDLQTEVRGALGGAGGILNGLGGLERASGGGSELEKKNSNDEEGEGRGRRSAVDGGGKEEEKDEGELEIVEVNSRSQYSSEEVRAGISQFKGQSFTATTEQDGVSSSLEEESVVVVMATTPVKEPAVVDSSLTLSPSSSLSQPLPASSSLSSLSAPWAHIFRQTARRSSQTKETVLVTGSPPGRTRGTNKAFKRSRSASSSPRRCRSLSRSPRSAKKGSPLVRQGRGSAADLASPLRASAKVRKLLSFTEPSPKRVRGEERDWAPFSGLSHIRQDDSSDPFWNLEPKVPVFHESLAATLSHVPTTFCTTMEPATPRNSVAPTPPRIPLAPTATNSSQGLPKSSSVEAQSGKAEPKAPALLIPTPPSQTNAILEEITQRHPQENVRDIFQRYRLLKPGRISLPNTTPASKGPPPAIRTISSTLNRPHRPKKRRPLICRVHIRNGEAGRIEVDASVYESLPQTRRRRSARLRAQLDHPLSLSPATDTQSDTLTETDGKEMEAEREREMGAEREREMEKERKRDVKTERKREVETESKGEKDTDRKREETDRKKEMEKKEETARKRETEKKKEIAIETKRENTPNVCSHSTNSGDGAREKTVYCSPCELWSDVYRPTSSTDVIGNRTGVQRLRNWLLQWKNKCSSNSQNSSDQKSRPVGNESGGRKQVKLNVSQENLKKVFPPTPESVAMEADPNFSLRVHRHHRKGMSLNARSSDCEGEGEGEGEVGDWKGGDGEEGVCSVLLLCGPEGCGKTAAVYACASELGFKVKS